MKLSNAFFVTRREFPKDETNISSKLLIKSGMIMKIENGNYVYLPFGFKVLENIKKVIRKEFNNINATETLSPSLLSSEVYESTGRDKILDNELFKIIDKNNKRYVLAPTNEEIFSLIAKYKINSYKDLHFTLFQISNKYRDENKLQSMIRKKEFLMADAYSFDTDATGCDVSYDKMFLAFKNIFTKMGLNTIVVRNDPYYMMGLSSEEFQVLDENGDNEIVKCTSCDYASNIEDASSKSRLKNKNEKLKNMFLVKTVNKKTIDEVSEYLKVDPNDIIKSIIVKVNEEYKMILLRGNSKLNINKLKRLFNSENITMPDNLELNKIGTSAGYIGPINATMEVIGDSEVKGMINAICGSNKENYHYINVVPGRDFRVNRYIDLKLFDENSLCPKCRNNCKILKGIEVGHIFKLGSSYSEIFDLKYTDEVNKTSLVHMGCYGIGLDRCLSSIVEENHDDKGIVWPIEIAPYKVSIVIANINDDEAKKYANNLYDKLNSEGIDTLLDDRKESIGTKFNDMDLIGIPLRITVGKDFNDGLLEVKLRTDDETKLIKKENLIKVITEIINILKD